MSTEACKEPAEHPRLLKLSSALFYAGSSFLITVVNKTVLTSFRFPSYLFLGIGQMITTIVVLYLAKRNNVVKFPDFDRSVFLKFTHVYGLTEIHHTDDNGAGSLFAKKNISKTYHRLCCDDGLWGHGGCEVQILFHPTFHLPRRLDVYRSVVVPIVAFVLIFFFFFYISVSSDLAFDVEAYTFILLNDAFTAATGVYTKKKLGDQGLGKYGVLFYNSLIIVFPTVLASAFTGDLHKALSFEDWSKVTFSFCFLLSCFMGFVLMYSIVLCSYYNSALTTTVVGAIKNVAVAYVGIFVGGDYLFSWTNFLGLSICMSGGLVYSFFTFNSSQSPGNNAESSQELKILITEDPSRKP
uniref:UDP-N-acetylglucosamine/UDP-glucose/GDP-mannose transporter n=1 Tax=Fundulus heteroclitus TaxID=8078 RepID=A0A3Q2PU72_FUNHE